MGHIVHKDRLKTGMVSNQSTDGLEYHENTDKPVEFSAWSVLLSS